MANFHDSRAVPNGDTWFEVSGPRDQQRVGFPREMLDDEAAVGATVEQRNRWVEESLSETMKVYCARTEGSGLFNSRFERVILEDIE